MSPRTLLICEDHKPDREALESFSKAYLIAVLSTEGTGVNWDLKSCASFTDAMDAVKTLGHHDIVFLDSRLPNMHDGERVLASLWRRRCSCFVVWHSAARAPDWAKDVYWFAGRKDRPKALEIAAAYQNWMEDPRIGVPATSLDGLSHLGALSLVAQCFLCLVSEGGTSHRNAKTHGNWDRPDWWRDQLGLEATGRQHAARTFRESLLVEWGMAEVLPKEVATLLDALTAETCQILPALVKAADNHLRRRLGDING